MALRKNDALRNAQATAFGALFNSGNLLLYTGGQPADPDSAASGSLLCTIDLPASPFNAAASGAITLLGTWNGVGTADGTVGWGRFISSDTLKTFDVTIGEAATDLIIDDDAIVTGGLVTVISFSFTVPDGV
jgi:hypothetical protein